MKLKSLFLYVFILFFINSCQFNQLSVDTSKKDLFSISFVNAVPDTFEKKLKFVFNSNRKIDTKAKISIQEYIFKNYDIFGGPALRSLEGELKLKINIEISTENKKIIKKLVTYKRYKSNELNPFAQEQMIKALESEMQNELINQIIFEVNAFEM